MAIVPPEMMALLLQLGKGQGTNLDALGRPANVAGEFVTSMIGNEPIPQTDEAGLLEPAIPSLTSRLSQDELSNPPSPRPYSGGNPLMAAIAGGLGALFGGKLGAGSALTTYGKTSQNRRQENLQREQLEERKRQQRIAQILQQSEIDMRQEQERRLRRAQAVAEAKTAADMKLTGARIGDLESQAASRAAEEKRKAGAPVFWETPEGLIGSGPPDQLPEGARRVSDTYGAAKVRAQEAAASREDTQKFQRDQAKERMDFDAGQKALDRKTKLDAALKTAGNRIDARQVQQINTVNRTLESNEAYKRTQKAAMGYAGIMQTMELLEKGGNPGNIDMEALYAWIKSIDESVVRPSETEMAKAGRSPVQNLQGFFNRIAGKGTLLPEERETLLKIMKGRLNSLIPAYVTLRKQKIDYLSRTAKIPPEDAAFFVPDMLDQFPEVLGLQGEFAKRGIKPVK